MKEEAVDSIILLHLVDGTLLPSLLAPACMPIAQRVGPRCLKAVFLCFFLGYNRIECIIIIVTVQGKK